MASRQAGSKPVRIRLAGAAGHDVQQARWPVGADVHDAGGEMGAAVRPARITVFQPTPSSRLTACFGGVVHRDGETGVP
jgi:hypothetical protein